jgi:NAD(P)-dependent dehydrogenase (short-subunit alcohol dehydrogenase family)
LGQWPIALRIMADQGVKTALIVGAGSGLSASLARLLAREGFKVGLAAREPQKLAALVAEIGGAAFAADASNPAEVAQLFDRVAERFDAPELAPSIPEIHILQRQFDLHRLDVGDRFLKIVALLAGHAQFVALDRDLDFQLCVLDLLDELLGEVAVHTLFYQNGLAQPVARGAFRVLEVERTPIKLAAGEMGEDKLVYLFHLQRIVGFKRQRIVLARERAGAAFEVEAGFDFALDIRERVIDLGEIGFRDNVETGHSG